MIDKYLIVVDERDQQAEIKNIARRLERKGIKLIYSQINLSKGKYHTRDSSGNPYVDREKIKKSISSVPFFSRVSTIATDYNLIDGIDGIQDNGLNGFEVITDILSLGYNPNKEIILYSSGIDRAYKDILESGSLADKINKLKIIQKGKVSFRKTDYSDKVVEILTKEPNTLDGIFARKMREYPQFKTDYFEGIQIYDLEQLLSNTDNVAMKLKKELVEQFIAYIINFENEE